MEQQEAVRVAREEAVALSLRAGLDKDRIALKGGVNGGLDCG